MVHIEIFFRWVSNSKMKGRDDDCVIMNPPEKKVADPSNTGISDEPTVSVCRSVFKPFKGVVLKFFSGGTNSSWKFFSDD